MAVQCRIQVAHSLSALRAIAPSTMLDDETADLFSTPAWFENLAATGFDGAAPLHLILAETGQTAVCLPLAEAPEAGASLTALSNYYSGLYAPMGPADSAPAELWQAVAEHLRNRRPRRPLVDLHPLNPDRPFFSAMLKALRAAGYWADSYFCFGNWYLRVGGRSYDAYQASLPSALRNTIARGRKKLDKAGNWHIDIRQEIGDALNPAIADFEAIYARSWKPPEGHPGFIRGLCRTAAEQGWLRLGILRLDGAPVAAQIWLCKGGRSLIYKLAYDERYRPLSAGSVLTAALMRHAIDIDRVEEVDYLMGDEPYKADWMSHRRERFGIVAFDPLTLRGLLAGLRHRAGRLFRGRPTPTPVSDPALP